MCWYPVPSFTSSRVHSTSGLNARPWPGAIPDRYLQVCAIQMVSGGLAGVRRQEGLPLAPRKRSRGRHNRHRRGGPLQTRGISNLVGGRGLGAPERDSDVGAQGETRWATGEQRGICSERALKNERAPGGETTGTGQRLWVTPRRCVGPPAHIIRR